MWTDAGRLALSFCMVAVAAVGCASADHDGSVGRQGGAEEITRSAAEELRGKGCISGVTLSAAQRGNTFDKKLQWRRLPKNLRHRDKVLHHDRKLAVDVHRAMRITYAARRTGRWRVLPGKYWQYCAASSSLVIDKRAVHVVEGALVRAAVNLETAPEPRPIAEAIWPLVPGRTWTYAELRGDGDCKSLTTRASDGETHAGKASVRYFQLCGDGLRQAVDVVVEGDRATLYSFPGGLALGPDPLVLNQAPVAEGTTWGAWRWRHHGPTTVPAGTFTDCWRREGIADVPDPYRDYAVYCRGVGLVSYVSPQGEYVLASKSF